MKAHAACPAAESLGSGCVMLQVYMWFLRVGGPVKAIACVLRMLGRNQCTMLFFHIVVSPFLL